ncbi:MAG: FadR/GntR family transcriptional regulator [Planctomycetota bacterium]
MSSLPVKGEPLLNSTVNTLRDRIMNGAYSDGMLPPQGTLCEELGVSRSVVREAMRQLQSLRLIEVSQGAPARVLPPGSAAMADSLHHFMCRTDASLTQLAEIRLPLEVEITGFAAERINAEGLLRLHIAVRRLTEAKTVEEQSDADLEFHRVLAESTGNPIFVFLLDALAELLRESRRRTIGRVGISPALAGHLAILQAIEKRDVKAARAAMGEHIRCAIRDLDPSNVIPSNR